MTIERAKILEALAEASAEGWVTAKDVAIRMGIKGSSPLVRSVRIDLEVMAKAGRVRTEVHPTAGRRFRSVEESAGPAGVFERMARRAQAEEDGVLPTYEDEDEQEESPEEPEEEAEAEPEQTPAQEPKAAEDGDGRLRRRSLPTATHRVLRVLSDGKARTLKELKGFGVSSTTLRPMREEGLVVSEPDGYRITDDGLRGLTELEEDWPQLRDAVYEWQEYVDFERPRPKGRMPTTVHAMLCALADGRPRRAKDLLAAGIGEKTHGTVYQHGWCERTGLGYAITESGRARLDEIERDWPQLRAKGRDVPVPAAEEPEPKAEPVPKMEPVPEPVRIPNELPDRDDPDPLPDDPPTGEAERTTLTEAQAVAIAQAFSAGISTDWKTDDVLFHLAPEEGEGGRLYLTDMFTGRQLTFDVREVAIAGSELRIVSGGGAFAMVLPYPPEAVE